MLRPPSRWKHSGDADPLARALLSAGLPTRPLPESSRIRGERRVARLASVPIVGLGVGLISKAAAAGFGLGVVSAVAVLSGVPSVRARLLAWRDLASTPAEVVVSTAAKAAGATDRTQPAAAASSGQALLEAPPASASTDMLSRPLPPNDRASARQRTARPERAALAPPPAASDVAPPPSVDITSLPAEDDRSVSAELSILLEAHRKLASDPDAALVTLGRHAAAFPGGALAMEREVLMIEALGRAGQRSEAARRAREMLAQSPNPFYAARLKQVIQAEP